MSMTVDYSDFEKGCAKIIKKASDEEAGKGLFKAGNELLRDAKLVVPMAPWKLGDLHASAQVNKAEVKKGEVSTVAGFNIEYAARWHELTPEEDSKISWTTPGSGRKYLESKMAMFKEKYMAIVAKHIENVLKGK